MTIHHVVFWKFNGQQPANFVDQLRAKAQAMVGALPSPFLAPSCSSAEYTRC